MWAALGKAAVGWFEQWILDDWRSRRLGNAAIQCNLSLGHTRWHNRDLDGRDVQGIWCRTKGFKDVTNSHVAVCT